MVQDIYVKIIFEFSRFTIMLIRMYEIVNVGSLECNGNIVPYIRYVMESGILR